MQLSVIPGWLTLPLLSTRLLVLLVSVCVLLLPATGWLWNRIGGPQVVRGAVRLGLLLACQVSAVLLIAAALNDYGYFYSSWSELLGRGASGPAVTVQGPARQLPDSVGVVGGSGRVLGPYRHQEGSQPAVAGQTVSVRLSGLRSGLSEVGYVYLPPEYFQPRFAGYRFPAVEVLTGYPGQAANLVQTLDFPAALLGAERAGTSGPMVLVMLRSSPAFPRDTECVDVPAGPQAMTFFAQDVPADVATLFRVRPLGWGAIGDSTGGYCALKLAMTSSYVFPAAVALSGYLQPVHDRSTGDLFAGRPGLRADADLLQRLADGRVPAAALLLTTSRTERGPSSLANVQAFVARSRPPLVVETLVEPDGGHNFDSWRPELPTAMAWLSRHLDAPPPAGAQEPKR